METKNVIIVGASSGIGEALVRWYSANHYNVGLMARRLDKMQDIVQGLATNSYIQSADISNREETLKAFDQLFTEMKTVDIVILNAGLGYANIELKWELEEAIINTNIKGTVSLALKSLEKFTQQGFGHLVVISSVAGLRGEADNPAYNASKSFLNRYCEGLIHKIHLLGLQNNIFITDILPGFVATPMTACDSKMALVCSSQEMAKLIYQAVAKKKKRVILPSLWRIPALIMPLIPDWLFYRMIQRTKAKYLGVSQKTL